MRGPEVGELISSGCSWKETRTLFFFLPDPSWDGVSSDVSLGGLIAAAVRGEKVIMGEAVRTEEAGLCFNAVFTGEMSLGGGLWCSGFRTGDAEKCAERCGLTEGFLPLSAAAGSIERGTSRLEDL